MSDRIPADKRAKIESHHKFVASQKRLDAATKQFIHDNKVLISYVRGPEKVYLRNFVDEYGDSCYEMDWQLGPIIGITVATGKGEVGWSRVKRGDRYNKYFGIREAISKIGVEPIYSMKQSVSKMTARAAKYFKETI